MKDPKQKNFNELKELNYIQLFGFLQLPSNQYYVRQ